MPGAFKLQHICSTLSPFCSKRFSTFSLLYWEANSYYPTGILMGKFFCLWLPYCVKVSGHQGGRLIGLFVLSISPFLSVRSPRPSRRCAGSRRPPQDCSSSCAVTVSRARKDNRERERDREGEREGERQAGRANDRKERARERARDKDAG